MRVIDYTLLTSTSPKGLVDGVRDLLREGWQPLGGVSVEASYTGATKLAQAMVKYAPPDDEDSVPPDAKM